MFSLVVLCNEGDTANLLFVCIQKTFLQELEIKVDERTQSLKTINESLEKSNEDLAQFAYIASHDLQEPLRKIRTFSQMISEKEAESLSEKGIMLLNSNGILILMIPLFSSIPLLHQK